MGAVDIELYAHWKLKDTVEKLATEVPENADIVSRRWIYDLKETAEGTSPTKDGWSNTGSYWKQINSGRYYFADFPGGYNSGDYKGYNNGRIWAYENEKNKRTVSEPAHNSYIYWHWTYEMDAWDYRTWDRKISDTYNTFLSGGGRATHWSAFESWTYYAPSSGGWTKIQTSDVWAASSFWWFRCDTYWQDYITYEKTYQFEKITNDLVSPTNPTGQSGVYNVRAYVTYRPI